MGIRFEELTCWGYSLDEYQKMFDLSAQDLEKSILDCAAGAASFNVELTQQAGRVVSFDPMYGKQKADVQQESIVALEQMRQGLQDNTDAFVWKTFKNPDELINAHTKAQQRFIDDFEQGVIEKRYVAETAPQLSFDDYQFELALSSHFLFLNKDMLDLDFHIQAISELCRVAGEVRIFPLLDEKGGITELVGPVMLHFQALNYGVEIRQVPYELRKGGNAMLRIWANDCPVVDNPK